jgi:hypothetical protein
MHTDKTNHEAAYGGNESGASPQTIKFSKVLLIFFLLIICVNLCASVANSSSILLRPRPRGAIFYV